MFKAGLVTVSFRALSPEQIVDLAVSCNLKELEWGGDVHVPCGDFDTARHVADLTKNAGLNVCAYGSYYRLGTNDDFAKVLKTACVLGAPIIRVWGGTKGSAEITKPEWEALVCEGQRITEMAKESGVIVALECHNNTLTDNYKTALEYLKLVPDMKMYWQPNQFQSEEYNRKAAEALAAYTTNIHVFHWDDKNRYPLEKGEAVWEQYLAKFSGGERCLLLEFMHDNRPESLADTAKVLHRLIKESV